MEARASHCVARELDEIGAPRHSAFDDFRDVAARQHARSVRGERGPGDRCVLAKLRRIRDFRQNQPVALRGGRRVLGEGGVVDVALLAAAVEGAAITGGERCAGLEAVDEVGVRDERCSERDCVRGASLERCLGRVAVVAAVDDDGAAKQRAERRDRVLGPERQPLGVGRRAHQVQVRERQRVQLVDQMRERRARIGIDHPVVGQRR